MKFISITPENVSNYEDIIKTQNMPSFVKFYSPNCGHCQAMQPAWDALENNTDVKGMGIAIIEVRDDAINSITHNSGKNVLGFPTIRVIINGKITKEYNGDRSTNDMVNFIKENIKLISILGIAFCISDIFIVIPSCSFSFNSSTTSTTSTTSTLDFNILHFFLCMHNPD